jgi:hypothetical protein
MSPEARNNTIQHFSKCMSYSWYQFDHLIFGSVNNVEVTVFLVSLKAGGVALNLTEVSPFSAYVSGIN